MENIVLYGQAADTQETLMIPLSFRANVSRGQESPDRTKKSNSILFYQKIPLGG